MIKRKVVLVILLVLIGARFILLPGEQPKPAVIIEEPVAEYEELILSTETLVMEYGETAVLSIISHPSLEAIWGSSDPDVATVDQDGNVVATGPGSALITVRVEREFATCWVTVNFATITFDPAMVVLRPGEQCAVQVFPALEVAWSIVGPYFASVDSQGLVTALSPGKAEIAATAWGVRAELPLIVYEKILSEEVVLKRLKASLPPEPKAEILADEEKLGKWLVSLSKWQEKLQSMGEYCLFPKKTIETVLSLTERYFTEPVWPLSVEEEEIVLPEGSFYPWREYNSFYEVAIVFTYGKIDGIWLAGEDTIVVTAILEGDVESTFEGEYTFFYRYVLLEDGSFRVEPYPDVEWSDSDYTE